jgi:hypothetical protein
MDSDLDTIHITLLEARMTRRPELQRNSDRR